LCGVAAVAGAFGAIGLVCYAAAFESLNYLSKTVAENWGKGRTHMMDTFTETFTSSGLISAANTLIISGTGAFANGVIDSAGAATASIAPVIIGPMAVYALAALRVRQYNR